MRKSLWIDIWNDRRKEKVIQRQQQGYSFLQSYTMTNFKNTLMELAKGLGMYKGSPTSCYVVIIPPNRKEVIRVRLSDHPSTKDEWVAGEITGLPNRRYSIVIFSNKSMPLQSKQNVKETDWTNYDVEGIPVYEKCFNRIYLKDTIQTLLNILISIYEGKSPSTGSTQITKENKQNTNINKNMKKQTIKLNESQLRGLIKESIKAILNENTFESSRWMEIIEEIHRLATELEELANAEDTPMTSGKLDLLKAAQSILKITTTFGGNMGLSSMINEDEFTPHGFYGDSNFGGKEIQISDDGEMARLRTDYGDGPSKPTRWLKIYFNNDGVAYVMFKGRRLRLDQFMRY